VEYYLLTSSLLDGAANKEAVDNVRCSAFSS